MIKPTTQWDRFFAYMIGLDDAVEKIILEYIYRRGKEAPLSEINLHMLQNDYATEGKTMRRLISLIKSGFLTKYEEHGRSWYKINEEKIEEEKTETINKYHKEVNTY